MGSQSLLLLLLHSVDLWLKAGHGSSLHCLIECSYSGVANSCRTIWLLCGLLCFLSNLSSHYFFFAFFLAAATSAWCLAVARAAAFCAAAFCAASFCAAVGPVGLGAALGAAATGWSWLQVSMSAWSAL